MSARWEIARSQEWSTATGWLCGVNYLPRHAVNSTAFWQVETFDQALIRQELAWAHSVGLNALRIFLQQRVWEQDRDGFLDRLECFLELASEAGCRVMPVLFDDCAFSGKQPYLGPQAQPVPGIHNSAWTPSPGHNRARAPELEPVLQAYVEALLQRFGTDGRVLAWDLYNEPGNGDQGNKSLVLLENVFDWARHCAPDQPLTVGVWDRPNLPELTARSLELSDIITFHFYGSLEKTRAEIEALTELAAGRPLLCTEWMARTLDSWWETHLPLWNDQGVGCFAWGLVQGATQTYMPWGSKEGDPEPEVWFHDILRPDGSPYKQVEIDLIQRLTQAAAADQS